MAFNILYEVDGAVETAKTGETVQVTISQIVNNGTESPPRIEARIHASNDKSGWAGPTKVALTFTDADDVVALMEMLQEAVDKFRTLPKAAKVAPVTPVRQIRKPSVAAQNLHAKTAAAKAVQPAKRTVTRPSMKAS